MKFYNNANETSNIIGSICIGEVICISGLVKGAIHTTLDFNKCMAVMEYIEKTNKLEDPQVAIPLDNYSCGCYLRMN